MGLHASTLTATLFFGSFVHLFVCFLACNLLSLCIPVFFHFLFRVVPMTMRTICRAVSASALSVSSADPSNTAGMLHQHCLC